MGGIGIRNPKHPGIRIPANSPFSPAATSVSWGVWASWLTTCGPAPAHPHSAAPTGKPCGFASVGDPVPDPWDPYDFGPHGSAFGSVGHRYGSGSGSFHHHAKIERETLSSSVLFLLYDFYQCSGSVGSVCFWASRIRIRIRYSDVRILGSGTASGSYGSGTEYGSYQNVMDLQHWYSEWFFLDLTFQMVSDPSWIFSILFNIILPLYRRLISV